MPINYVKGDAVKALKRGGIDWLVHCCNCQNKFGSGIARQIKREVPDAYALDTWCYKNDKNKLGSAWFSEGGVVNLYGQYYYGTDRRHLSYGALCQGLINIRNEIKLTPDAKIAFPYKFASDRAGGDWEIVLELIEWYLGEYDVYIYKLEG